MNELIFTFKGYLILSKIEKNQNKTFSIPYYLLDKVQLLSPRYGGP